MAAFLSSDGGTSWTAPVTISSIQFHADAGGFAADRCLPLLSMARERLGRLGRLPLSIGMHDQRPGLQHFGRWSELERGHAHSD